MRNSDNIWWIAGYDIRRLICASSCVEVLSVDPCIWPSILEDVCEERGLFKEYEQQSNWVSLLPSVESLVDLLGSTSEVGTIIEISFPKKALITLHGFLGAIEASSTKRFYSDKATRLIGFDVADPRTLTSAIHLLKNGKKILPVATKLVANGLFQTLECAEQACCLASTIIPEHAPFFPAQLKCIDLQSC